VKVYLTATAVWVVFAMSMWWILGCATASRWVPCPDSVTIDGHVTHGKYDGSGPSNTGEADGYDSNYESYEFGGALHSKLGVEPEHCLTLGGTPKE